MTKTLEELQEQHSEMLATASDIGLTVPDELRADFTDATAGGTIVQNLDVLIREHQAKGQNGVASDDKTVQNDEVKKAEPRKRTAKKTGAKVAPAKPAKTASTSTKKVEADAEKAPAVEKKVSKAAKKTKAKKAAKKSASGNARKRVTFAEDAKITVVAGKENPAREGSGKFDRIKQVLAHNGKTVKTYLTKGKKGTLGWCVAHGLVKVA